MTLTPLAAIILAHFLVHRPPGRSPYSFEPVLACGTNPSAASCALEPVCDESAFWCSAPRWSDSRNAWVRVESRETAVLRYAQIAEDLAFTSRYVTRCVGADGVAVESCERAAWWRGAEDLALVGTVIAVFESGLAEGVQAGHPPLGIGNHGEVCLMGLIPEYAPAYATWLPREQRKALVAGKRKDVTEWGMRDLFGMANVRHCMEVSLRQLVRHRKSCKSDYGMFSGYASGRCDSREKTVTMRTSFLEQLRRRRVPVPEWAAEILARSPDRPR